MPALLRMSGIVKTFPGVHALQSVDFEVQAGKVHALMGENGAGKSTLLKVLTGSYQADRGQIELEGRVIRPRSPQEATKLGISAVYQELTLVPNLSIAENIVIGREPMGLMGIRWKALRERAAQALARLGLELDINRPVGSCSPAIQHLTAIARALDVEAKLLVLDEPTASLDSGEVDALFEVIHRLKAQGLGIVYVTHFLDEVYRIADSITVLRNGALVATDTLEAMPKRALVTHMIGREGPINDEHVPKEVPPDSEVWVEAQQLGKKHSVSGLNFTVRAGEVLGLAGLLGSGRTETLRLLFGIDRPDQGAIRMRGKQISLSPRKALRQGCGMLTEERKAEGIFPNLSVRDNMMIVAQVQKGWFSRVSTQEVLKAEKLKEELRIATPDLHHPIGGLSGGNQQKALLSRWLIANPKLFLLDEPTRGIDIGAKFEVTGLIERLRQQGMAFVLVSSELSELVQSSTKVAILRDRRMVGEAEEMTEPAILAQIAEGKD
jgi:monosaccharide-transporting ATPase